MYLRFGWVVGHVGLGLALLVVVVANVITLLTTLSFSAIATNSEVGIGGAYYMISRSLGAEFGGAIGLPLFLSQAFSVTLYAFGLAESLQLVLPSLPLQPVALVIIIAVALLSMRGASIALKAQLPIMVLIFASLVALAMGAFAHSATVIQPALHHRGGVGFWQVFAVFFPAVTGVMAGLGLSGDLAKPSRSIPLGSIAASLVGFSVYLAIPFLLSMSASPAELRSNPLIWTHIAVGGAFLIMPGLWGAIFSSAVGSMLGAPRTLQALAMDGLAPTKLSEAKEGSEPMLGIFVTIALALGAVFIGDLNRVAVVVTMFFLTVYGMVNLVAALETLSGSISWRPKIRVPWLLSLAGAAGCFAAMFLINAWASVVAISIELGLWLVLKRRERKSEWGDSRRDVYEALVRWALLQLRQRPMSARNWRPHVLIFAGNLLKRLDLLQFGHWFVQGRGVVTACELVIDDPLTCAVDTLERRALLEKKIAEEGLAIFPEVNVAAGLESGIIDVAQANGFAGIESNTIILGWRDESEKLAEFLRVAQALDRLKKSLIIAKTGSRMLMIRRPQRQVHLWWGGLERNGDLMLLLAHLLTHNRDWRGSKITVLSIASSDLMQQQVENKLAKLLPQIRIEAEVKVLRKAKDQAIHELIRETSEEADLVFLGLASPADGEEQKYAERLIELTEGLDSFFLVKNSSLFVGELLG